MLFNRVGNSGLQISRLSFGSWVTFHSQVDIQKAAELMNYAFEQGINFFDNAEVYAGGRSEIIMGEVLKKLNWPRLKYIVSTKFYWGLSDGPNQRNTLNRKYLIESMNQSLKRLQLDYVDLVYAHRPDPNTPIYETVRAMNDIIEKGQALYWGTSEWSAQEIKSAYDIAKQNSWHLPIVEQPQYNLFERQKVDEDYISLYKDIGLGLTTWSPLASGLLTGKYLTEVPSGSRLSLKSMSWLKEELENKSKVDQVKQFVKLAQDVGYKPSQLAIAWCLANPNVSSVILGATSLEQLKENLGSLNIFEKMDEDLKKHIDQIFL